MSHYLVLLILEFLPAWLATLPYGLDSNVTQLLANLLKKPSVFYYFPIVSCNLVSIKLLLLLLLLYKAQPHDVDDTTTRNTDRDKAWPPTTPGVQEAEGDIQQLTATTENNTHRLGEQMQNSNEVTQRWAQIYVSPTSKYKFSETRTWSSKVSLFSNITPRMSRLGLVRIDTPDKTNSPWGGLTVLDLLTTP